MLQYLFVGEHCWSYVMLDCGQGTSLLRASLRDQPGWWASKVTNESQPEAAIFFEKTRSHLLNSFLITKLRFLWKHVQVTFNQCELIFTLTHSPNPDTSVLRLSESWSYTAWKQESGTLDEKGCYQKKRSFRMSEGGSVSPLQTVMVQCGEQKLQVRAQLDLFGTRHLINAADLTLGTEGCQPTRIYPENHTVLFDYGLHECGSRLQMTGDFLIYTTHLTHIPNYPGSVIVRTNGAVIPIVCRYLRTGNVSSDPIKPTWIPFSSTRSGEGHLSFSLRLMNGDWLTERTSTLYSLGDLIHIEASVSMDNHMPLKLYIDRCVATLSPDKDSSPGYSIIDYNGCLMDSKAEDSFSTFVLLRDQREPDKLRFDLDAFRFYGDELSLIFITCHLKVAAVDQGNSRNKACTFQKLHQIWTPLEQSTSDICACCHVGNCGSTGEIIFSSRGRRDLGPEAGRSLTPEMMGLYNLSLNLTVLFSPAESEAGLKWEGEASLGPLLIVDPELTSLATEPLTEVEQRMQEMSPGGVQSELVVMLSLTVTAVSLISALLMALILYRKHQPAPLNY
ncbi:zona pellucida sperm-binding protein 3-like [Stegostoma tigrinum]|uniref:zona pellucida sperm-binding protein 3-like n=1 Tax=Stegostoma tigrinum TaxID=3053191 RepID=UPI00287024DE|nr:zona pellucida sperm-binding protein 3-like [Stegostoma tigrinum]